WGDAEKALDRDDGEEELDTQPGAERRAPVSGQRGEHRLVDPEPARAPEQQPAKVRIVEAHHEAVEIVVALAHDALVAGEAPGREVTGPEPRIDRGGRLETALHGQEHAGGE